MKFNLIPAGAPTNQTIMAKKTKYMKIALRLAHAA